MSPAGPKPKARSWYLPVLVFVLAGPLAAGVAFLIETLVLAGPPPLSAASLALRILVVAYVFGVVPASLTGYFHFYSRSWLQPPLLRTLATCVLGGALAAILPSLGGQGGLILAYAIAGAVGAATGVALTARFFPDNSDGLPPSRAA